MPVRIRLLYAYTYIVLREILHGDIVFRWNTRIYLRNKLVFFQTSGLSCVPDDPHLAHLSILSPSIHLWSSKKKVLAYQQHALPSIDIPVPLTRILCLFTSSNSPTSTSTGDFRN